MQSGPLDFEFNFDWGSERQDVVSEKVAKMPFSFTFSSEVKSNNYLMTQARKDTSGYNSGGNSDTQWNFSNLDRSDRISMMYKVLKGQNAHDSMVVSPREDDSARVMEVQERVLDSENKPISDR